MMQPRETKRRGATPPKILSGTLIAIKNTILIYISECLHARRKNINAISLTWILCFLYSDSSYLFELLKVYNV